MKVRKYTIVILFLMLSVAHSQSKKSDLKIIYEVQSLRSVEKTEGAEAKELLSATIALLENFEFELLVNKDEALFKKSKQLISDDSADYINDIAIAFCHGEKIWYNGVNDSIKYALTEESGEPLLLVLEEKLDWKLTGEKKKFGDFELIKATSHRIEGTQELPISAWFTSELPYNFGPLGVDGLPGLIVELQINNLIFKINNIKKESVAIKKPQSSNVLTYQDYFAKLDMEMQSIIERGY